MLYFPLAVFVTCIIGALMNYGTYVREQYEYEETTKIIELFRQDREIMSDERSNFYYRHGPVARSRSDRCRCHPVDSEQARGTARIRSNGAQAESLATVAGTAGE